MTDIQKKKIKTSIIIKSVLIASFIAGLIFKLALDDGAKHIPFLYYTYQSNIWISAIVAVMLVFDILSLKRNCEVVPPNWVRTIKFVFTVAITLTGIIYNFMLYPAALLGGQNPLIILYPYNLFTHVVVPTLSIVDWCLYDHKLNTGKFSFLFALITPLYYFAFALSCRALNIGFGKNLKFPYFFLDYETNTWFNIGGGKFGTFYWLIIVAAVVIGISILLL